MAVRPWGARRLLVAAGLLVGYVALDWVSFIHQFAPIGITPWNPPPGMALALLVVLGFDYLPVLFFSALTADIAVRELPAPLVPTILSALVITLCYGGAALALRRAGFDRNLARQRDVFWLIVVACLTALVVAVLYVGLFIAAGELSPAEFLPAAARYWIGDVIGVAVVTPFLLVHRRVPTRPGPRLVGEALLQGLAIALVLWLVFGVASADRLRYFYLLFLPLIWVSARFGIPGATAGNLVAQVGLIVAFETVVQDSTTVTAFQFLMLALTLGTLFLGAAVSERRRAEASLRVRQDELAHFSRLSLAGEMAAALAHELNQPLLATIAFTRAAQRLLGPPANDPAKAAGAMDKAVVQAERAGEIVRTLREFIGKGEPRRQRLAVAELVAEAIGLVAPECARHGVQVTTAVDKSLPPVHVDRVQIQQVLINLVRNGMEAMVKQAGGRREVAVILRAGGRGEVEVEVRDSGPGISPDVAERLFQPFTTTKATGMGLGLSISRTIVEAHGGRLWLAEGGAAGSAFRFTLPVPQDKGE